jgi:hypothetical protein
MDAKRRLIRGFVLRVEEPRRLGTIRRAQALLLSGGVVLNVVAAIVAAPIKAIPLLHNFIGYEAKANLGCQLASSREVVPDYLQDSASLVNLLANVLALPDRTFCNWLMHKHIS